MSDPRRPIPDEQLAAWHDLEHAATSGPWERGDWYHTQGASRCSCRPERGPLVGAVHDGLGREIHVHRLPAPVGDGSIRARDDSIGGVDVFVADEHGGMRSADADFVVAAREAVPALLAEVTALRQKLAAIRALCDEPVSAEDLDPISADHEAGYQIALQAVERILDDRDEHSI